MENDEKKDFDSFLQKVEDIESIIRQFSETKDSEGHSEAVKKADLLMEKLSLSEKKNIDETENTGFNKTVINKDAFKDDPRPPACGPQFDEGIQSDAFMNAMEADSRKRFERRKAREKIAIEWKEKGNVEFKNGNYEKAIEYYTKGLDEANDMKTLYTNRAQAYIKLGMHDKALVDCDWALRVNQDDIKAYVHQGRAYLGMCDYEKAKESFYHVLKIDPKKENVVKDYINEVELAENTVRDDAKVKELFEGGDEEIKNLSDIMEKLKSPDHVLFYYSGGLRLISKLLNNPTDRALFRTKGGFDYVKSHPVISKCFKANPKSQSKEERDVCWAVLDLYTTACIECEENVKCMMELPEFPERILHFLELRSRGRRTLKEASVNLLHTLSQTEFGRVKILNKFDISKLTTLTIGAIKIGGVLGLNSIGLLNNIALEKKFKTHIRTTFESDVLPAFEDLLNETSMKNESVPISINMVTNLSGDTSIRSKMAHRKTCFDKCLRVLDHHGNDLSDHFNEECVYSVLGLLNNLTTESTETCLQSAPSLSPPLYCLTRCQIPHVEERSLGVLSHILPKSPAALQEIYCQDFLKQLLSIVKDGREELLGHSIRCLSACTLNNEEAKDHIAEDYDGIAAMIKLLKHSDENVIGNAASCLSHCVQVPSVCKRLTDTNIIMDLLVLARDGKKETVQRNAAILIARLAQGDQKHLIRLRELDGIGILHSCMKYV